MSINQFKCECGKEFTNPQSFNGHKSNCHVHILTKYPSVEEYYKNKKPLSNNGAIKSHQKKLDREARWISEKHTCEKCGKIMTEKFGSGRFCSRACANSRNHSLETISKIKTSINLKWEPIRQETLRKKELQKALNFESSKKLSLEQRAKLIERFNLERQEIQIHNSQIIAEYENFLLHKSENKIEIFPETQFEFAQYLATYDKTHPRNKEGVVFIHILLAEQLLDRKLNPLEIVHHKNENKLDNRFTNYWIFDNKASHAKYHLSLIYYLTIENDVLHCESIEYPKWYKKYLKTNNLI